MQPPTVGSTPVRPVTDGVGPTGTVAAAGGGAKGGHPIAADAKPGTVVDGGNGHTPFHQDSSLPSMRAHRHTRAYTYTYTHGHKN